jgi:hypothetical protein
MIAPESDFLQPASGFVVAMRARLIVPRAPVRFEWIVVSRWGNDGEHLLISWTSLSASSGKAPFRLAPHRTALATAPDRSTGVAPVTFLLTPLLPEGVLVTGEFLPARGYVKLFGTRPNLRVQSVGRGLNPNLQSGWRMDARRVEWFGEYFEDAGPRSTCT